MNSRHRQTLAALFEIPTLANIVFSEIEALLMALGYVRKEGAGCRVRFTKGIHRIAMHRPHPGKEAKRYQVEEVRSILTEAGIKPE